MTNLFRIAETQWDCEALQKDLYKLGEWVLKWQMQFDVNRCKVMDMDGEAGRILTHGG